MYYNDFFALPGWYGISPLVRHQGERNAYSTIAQDDRSVVLGQLVDREGLRISDYTLGLRNDGANDERPAESGDSVENLTFQLEKKAFAPENKLYIVQHDSSITIDTQVDYREHAVQDEEDRALRPELLPQDVSLINRLARISSRRRQQFVYWRHRQDRSSMAALRSDPPTRAAEGDAGLGKVQDAARPAVPIVFPVSHPSSVTKVQLQQTDLAERRSVASDISRAPSATGPRGEKAEWPSVPAGIVSRGSYFICPYCFNVCPDRYLSAAAWKAHLIHDLRPYCCTYYSCDSGDQTYDNWADWSTHEDLVHNKVWVCLEHTDEEFPSIEDYEDHVKKDHRENAEFMLTPESKGARATGSARSNRTCPFCLTAIDNNGRLQHHIAWHLETIALMALPRSTGHEVGSENGDVASNDVAENDSAAGRPHIGSVFENDPPDSGVIFPSSSARLTGKALQQLAKGLESSSTGDHPGQSNDAESVSTGTSTATQKPELKERETVISLHEDLTDFPHETKGREQSSSHVLSPDAEPDILIIEYELQYFYLKCPPYSIYEGLVSLQQLRDAVAYGLRVAPATVLQLVYQEASLQLDWDQKPLNEFSIKHFSQITAIDTGVSASEAVTEYSALVAQTSKENLQVLGKDFSTMVDLLTKSVQLVRSFHTIVDFVPSDLTRSFHILQRHEKIIIHLRDSIKSVEHRKWLALWRPPAFGAKQMITDYARIRDLLEIRRNQIGPEDPEMARESVHQQVIDVSAQLYNDLTSQKNFEVNLRDAEGALSAIASVDHLR